MSMGASEHHRLAVQSLLPSPRLEVSPQNLKVPMNRLKTISLDDLNKD